MTKIRLELDDVTPHNFKQLKRLNQAIFPVSYNDRFYKDVVNSGDLSKLAYFNDLVVGAVCCRIEITPATSSSPSKRKMYIMTLGCLAQFRRYGVGTMLLKHVFSLCEKYRSIDSIYLHVQVNNEAAIKFYEKHGFVKKELKSGYYRRIEPTDAYLVEKDLKNEDNDETSNH